MYCNQCHNARALAEKPYINYENVAAHMRVRANLTGEEHAKLLAFMQRWHDVPSPSPPVEGPPKRLIFSQPIAELRAEEQAKERAAQAPAPGGAGAPAPGGAGAFAPGGAGAPAPGGGGAAAPGPGPSLPPALP
jgi:hypothetical protein